MSFVFYSSYFDGDLSKWNLSNIDNCNNMFENSNFNNDSICNWNVSNVKKTISMFEKSKFNKSLNNWDVSNIINMKYMFEQSKFSGNISSWILNHKIYCDKIFFNNENFIKRYNQGKEIPEDTNEFLEWFESNKKNIGYLNMSKEEIIELDDYLISFNEIHKDIL